MPECGIGFHVDVGLNYYLSRIHSNLGLYIALTGYRLNAKGIQFFYIY